MVEGGVSYKRENETQIKSKASEERKRDVRRGQRCGNPIATYEPCWRGKGGADGGGQQRTEHEG